MKKYRKITDISLVTDTISIYQTRSPATAGIANRPLVFATRTTLSGHNIEF